MMNLWIITHRYKENIETHQEGVSKRTKDITYILFVFMNGRFQVALTHENTCTAVGKGTRMLKLN